jgi:hypothetical protein
MKNSYTSRQQFLLFILLFLAGCQLEQLREEDMNSMSVVIHGKSYPLKNVTGFGGYNPLGFPASCSGYLLDNELYVCMKLGDTVKVGSIKVELTDTVKYIVSYDSCSTINGSGVVIAQYYTHKGADRAKGTFSFDAIDGKDTLHFTGGQFDVYLRGAD